MPVPASKRLDVLEKIMTAQREQNEKLITALLAAEREVARLTGDDNEDALSLISGYGGAMPLGSDYTANTRSGKKSKGRKSGGKKKRRGTGGKKKKAPKRR